ncbi:hypothetical protein PsYK624_056470 [Phanerochaete sordida]|uniref:Uncharacterized protein n=1 Tax=Phanerochaete sordida TaxID=48140 RepID=A0A9P3LCG2_9APHY|nr:hypothetical protein PsYK624_056470 [Phanerochaete sordida]
MIYGFHRSVRSSPDSLYLSKSSHATKTMYGPAVRQRWTEPSLKPVPADATIRRLNTSQKAHFFQMNSVCPIRGMDPDEGRRPMPEREFSSRLPWCSSVTSHARVRCLVPSARRGHSGRARTPHCDTGPASRQGLAHPPSDAPPSRTRPRFAARSVMRAHGAAHGRASGFARLARVSPRGAAWAPAGAQQQPTPPHGAAPALAVLCYRRAPARPRDPGRAHPHGHPGVSAAHTSGSSTGSPAHGEGPRSKGPRARQQQGLQGLQGPGGLRLLMTIARACAGRIAAAPIWRRTSPPQGSSGLGTRTRVRAPAAHATAGDAALRGVPPRRGPWPLQRGAAAAARGGDYTTCLSGRCTGGAGLAGGGACPARERRL